MASATSITPAWSVRSRSWPITRSAALSKNRSDPGALLESLFQAAVDAARPGRCVAAHLPERRDGRLLVLGAGKAAAAMAKAVEENWIGAISGLVVTRYGHAAPCRSVEVAEAGHPIPDARGEAAARRILAMTERATREDSVLCLISGGGSALLSLPASGITLADKQAINSALLASGATISEINMVRKHLSAIKGGRLAAAAWPASLLTLAISDVPGDDPAVIASGPTVADPSTFAEARAVLAKYKIAPPHAVRLRLEEATDETPKPGDPRLAQARYVLIASPRLALEAAAARAKAEGYGPVVLGDSIEGEASKIGADHAALVARAKPGQIFLSGGETTVTVTGKGRGGRNTEYLLALAIALDGRPGVHAIACDTDGIDGSEDNAGAIIAPDTLARAAVLGLDPKAFLANNDAYGFFQALGDLVVTGPTQTNVNDFRAILIS
jgi:hydroxypyruvate reductase